MSIRDNYSMFRDNNACVPDSYPNDSNYREKVQTFIRNLSLVNEDNGPRTATLSETQENNFQVERSFPPDILVKFGIYEFLWPC